MKTQVYKLVAIFNQYGHCGFVAENVTIGDALNGFAAKYNFDGAIDQIDRIVAID